MNTRTARILFLFIPIVLTAAFLASCGDDQTKPAANEEVEVLTESFLPAQVEITTGQSVRWVNNLRKDANSLRTVTSGKPTDPPEMQGLLFDVELDGYDSGEPWGDVFVFEFNDPEVDTVYYFSRYPAGNEFTGRVLVW